MKKIATLLLAAVLLLGVTACGKQPEAATASGSSVVYATKEPDHLNDVLNQIFVDISMKGQLDAGDEELTNLFHLDLTQVEDYAVRYTDGRYGVADVAILKAAEGAEEDLMAALEQRKLDRVTEFENYDIHNALQIASNAEIYLRGRYVILLMVEDTAAAERVILEQIPG